MKKLIFTLFCMLISYSAQSQKCYTSDNSPMVKYFLSAIDNVDTTKIVNYLNAGISINGTYCGKNVDYLDSRTSINELAYDYQKPFIIKAIENRNLFMIRFMIEKGANVNQIFSIPVNKYTGPPGEENNRYNWVGGLLTYCPLAYAVNKDLSSKPDYKTIETLLDNGADPNMALWDAQSSNDINMWQIFNKRGLKLNFTSSDLFQALESGNLTNCYYLIKNGAKADNQCFASATRKGNIPLLTKFLEQGCDINAPNDFWNRGYWLIYRISPVAWAAMNGDLKTVKFLVENGADISKPIIFQHPNSLTTTLSLVEFSEYKNEEGFARNPEVTEYLLLAPSIQKKKLEENQNNILKYRNEAKSHLNEGKFEESIESYNKAFQISHDPKDKNGVGIYFMDKGFYQFNTSHNYDSSAYFYSQAYKFSNQSVDYLSYAKSLCESGKHDEALKVYTELLQKDDINKPDVYLELGLCYNKSGKKENAEQSFRKALSACKTNEYYNKAGCYALLNDKENSLANLTLAFENNFRDFENLENDAKFDNLKAEKKFMNLVSKYKRKLK